MVLAHGIYDQNLRLVPFDDNGYMLTGYQKDPAGEGFFLRPDKDVAEGKCVVIDDQGELKIAKFDWINKRYKI